MDRRQIATLLVLKELGIDQRMRTFRDRLVVQKSVYLVQAAGLDLGYFYTWYLRGPYCSAVAKDLFDASDETVDPTWKLAPPTRRELGQLKNVLQPGPMNKARWLELLASVHFLVDRKQVDANDAKTIAKRLKAFNKDFKISEVQGALTKLRGAKLLKHARN